MMRPQIYRRHPEERALARVSKGDCAEHHPSRLAVKDGEHLRMTQQPNEISQEDML
ncbi:MAG: hypothetical protein QOJ96_373 [Alphaproteobacteria bacterium]|jgi:hypothetical protein|nr:hypothetical protein [Alphaproteobacteria bacterium]